MSLPADAWVGFHPAEELATRGSLAIAIYIHDLAGGGVERQSLVLAEEFRRAGHAVTLLLHRFAGQLRSQVPACLPVVSFDGSRTLADIPRLASYLRVQRPDILLSNVDMNNVAALLARALASGPTKVVICQHNAISSGAIIGGAWHYAHTARAYRLLTPFVARAVAVSDGVARELRELAGLPADRVVTIYNPVVGPEFMTLSTEPARHRFFEDATEPVFVTAGRLVPQKDHETMIRALALHRQRESGRLIVLGSGSERDSLISLSQSLGVGDAVDFVGFQMNALPFFRQADAFLLTSRCEGFGNVIVEALACGTPVISTDCPHGPYEILEGGRYGVLVQPGNPAAVAEAMSQVGTLRARFPGGDLRRRASDFSCEACAGRYLELFKSLLPRLASAV